MKLKDLAKTYKLDYKLLSKYVNESKKYGFSEGTFGGISVDDSQINLLVSDFQASIAAEEIMRREQARLAEEAKEEQTRLIEKAKIDKQIALSQMLITSGFNFDGYSVVKYSGYISGDDAIQVPRGKEGFFSNVTNVSDALMETLTRIRRKALAELKEQAYDLGCNAIIGVDFDYINLEPETVNSSGGTLYLPYVFGVTANGNAVIIEKNE